VLLVAQPGDGEAADRVEVVGVAVGGHHLALDVDAGAVEEGAGDVGDVVATVTLLGPAGVVGRQPLGARLHGFGEVLDLHAGVVVVELALDRPAVGVEHARDAVADHRRAAVADVQRAGRVGRDVLDAGGASGAGVAAAV